jgi:uncharacterized protein (TIGR00251 family)
METRIRVRLTPRAAQDRIVGWEGETLRVRVTAPPVDGKANAALERLLAKELGLPKGAVAVIGGHTSRDKTVAIGGVVLEQIKAKVR